MQLKAYLEFEMRSLEEVKLLLQSWQKVLAPVHKVEVRGPRLTEDHLVNIALDDRQRPEDLVVL